MQEKHINCTQKRLCPDFLKKKSKENRPKEFRKFQSRNYKIFQKIPYNGSDTMLQDSRIGRLTDFWMID